MSLMPGESFPEDLKEQLTDSLARVNLVAGIGKAIHAAKEQIESLKRTPGYEEVNLRPPEGYAFVITSLGNEFEIGTFARGGCYSDSGWDFRKVLIPRKEGKSPVFIATEISAPASTDTAGNIYAYNSDGSLCCKIARNGSGWHEVSVLPQDDLPEQVITSDLFFGATSVQTSR